MTCREAIAILAEYLEATLSPWRLDRLQGHLRECDECQAYVATYRRTRDLAARVARVEMPVAMKDRLRTFLIDELSGPL